MSIFKKPYEISLWDDRLTLVDLDGKEYTGAVSDDVVFYTSYYKEIKICVIGSNEMDTPIRAFEPKLVRNVNGTNTFSFSIYAKYYDEESGEMVDNPFVPYLTNERKLKLKYLSKGEWKWLDFIIKKIDESSNDYVFTYTAEDLFINELSKSGFSLTFDAEIGNNTGTVNELGALVLDGTDWQIGEDSELIQQLVEEPLYKIKLAEDITVKKIEDDSTFVIKAGKYVYGFYSQIVNKDNFFFQVIYNEDENYAIDENRVLTNATVFYLPEGQPAWSGNLPSFAEEMEYTSEYRGEHYVKQQKTVYDPIVEQYVKVYSDGETEVRGYSEQDYIVPSTTKNLVVNSSDFVSTTGWKAKEYEAVELQYNSNTSYLKVSTEAEDAETLTIHNFGFYTQVSEFAPIKENEQFAFAIKAYYDDNDRTKATLTASIINKSDSTEGDLSFNASADESLKTYFEENGYTYLQGKYEQPQSLKTFEEIRHYIELSFRISPNQKSVLIEDVQLFKIVTEEKDGEVYYRLPNGATVKDGQLLSEPLAATIKENKIFYKFDENVTSKDQLAQLDPNKDYRPVYQNGYEKVRSITASESNRFNLLQNLSEAFECWCRFEIKHKDTGEILLGKDNLETIISGGTANSTLNEVNMYSAGSSNQSLSDVSIYSGGSSRDKRYSQQKFVTFHKRIGQEQHAGFRYGINLKGIKRSLDSGDLATKLIVKNNTNEFAENGSCNISIASSNPSGENFILDFSYYIKQGLLNYENFYRELYSENEQRGWIGYFTKLKRLNNTNQKNLIEREAALLTFQKVGAELEAISGEVEQTNTELTAQKSEFLDRTKKKYENIDTKDPWLEQLDVKGIYENIGRLELSLTSLKGKKKTLDEDYEELDKKIKSLAEEIASNKAKRQSLTQTFEKKYSRFIQEASWISEDYKDNELYYIDAESTLHKASQPKLSYNIEVIALAALEEYEGYDFDLGDITFVEDSEFFGWVEKDGIKRPYREQIVVTETTTNFDSPEKDSIKVQNYRTQFEDLFQRMAASTQKLEFYSGAYDRAADTVNTDGSIVPEALADAFANNAHILRNSKNQSVVWGDEGLVATNTTNPAEIVRLVSGGLFVTDDGGETWSAGITGKGINARVVTAGELNTDKVTIMSNGKPAFKWNKEGINAYAENEDGTLTSAKYTRFNSDGLVGKNGDVERFKLDWDGLQIRNQNNQEVFNADDNGDLTITGTIKAKNGNIGNWEIEEDGLSYIEEGKTEPSCYLGPKGTTHNDKTYVFKAGDNFGVTPDGKVYATGAVLEEAIVSGTITAGKGGSIGGISINTDGISSSEAPEVPYVDMARYSINDNKTSKTAKITNFQPNHEESTWYNYHFDVTGLSGFVLTGTGLTSKAQSDGHTYQVEFYFLEDKPTENNDSFPYLARAKTNVTYPSNGTVKWTIPNNAKYLLINQSVPFNDEQIEKAVEIESRGFELTKEGKLNAEAGRIGGFEITKDSIKNENVALDDTGLHAGQASVSIDGRGKFTDLNIQSMFDIINFEPVIASTSDVITYNYGASIKALMIDQNKCRVVVNTTEAIKANKNFKVRITYVLNGKTQDVYAMVEVKAESEKGSVEIVLPSGANFKEHNPTYVDFSQTITSTENGSALGIKGKLKLLDKSDILINNTSLIARLKAIEEALGIEPATIEE